MKILVAGTVEKISTRSDNTLVVGFGTQEMEPTAVGQLYSFRNKYVKLLISDSNITDIESKLVDAENVTASKKKKSPSMRLRDVLFRSHQQQRITAPFEEWYNNEIERLIEHYKDSLN